MTAPALPSPARSGAPIAAPITPPACFSGSSAPVAVVAAAEMEPADDRAAQQERARARSAARACDGFRRRRRRRGAARRSTPRRPASAIGTSTLPRPRSAAAAASMPRPTGPTTSEKIASRLSSPKTARPIASASMRWSASCSENSSRQAARVWTRALRPLPCARGLGLTARSHAPKLTPPTLATRGSWRPRPGPERPTTGRTA